MLVDPFFSQSRADQRQRVSFTRQQASAFAKDIADDFNPLHDINAKRFCVPGDLLFALVLANYGVSQHMHFTFNGMVTEDVGLILPEPGNHLAISGDNEKRYLSVEASGEVSHQKSLIDNLTRSYVTFSGRTFPHVLIPLMRDKNVMINPNRPMVMYESMLIDLARLDLQEITLELNEANTTLEVNGKRGNVCLAFNLLSGGDIIGRGEKHMLLSGLSPFDQNVVDQIIADYNAWKQAYHGPSASADSQTAVS